ncbi:hypothetical protein tb265_47240 [Gemmatimonadetes bacterium T265]|nr:hypothetical protein tb265_47240 [Gemmatimonadetes bacterium T265]
MVRPPRRRRGGRAPRGGASRAARDRRGRAAPLDFRGRLLVALSDADMVASAYIDGRLGPPRGADALTVVRLDRVRGRARPLDTLAVGRAAVGNSVTGPPAAAALTPDGRYAVVVETLGARRPGAADSLLRDLPLGRTIVVVDLGDPDHPAVVQRVACPAQPETVAIDAAGAHVAVTFGPKGAGPTTPLLLYRFRDGRLTGGVAPAVPGWPAGHPVRDAEFGPPGARADVLALLDATTPAVTFARVTGVTGDGTATGGAGRAPRLVPRGAAVPLARLGGPFLVRWTPDGRHVVVNGNDTDPAAGPDDGYGRPRGVVVGIRVGTGRTADPPRVVGRAVVGAGPEGLAVSPDGRWVATSNLERSYLPFADPRQTFFASLSLARLDPATGALTRVGDFPFDGVLPETVLFDNSSRYVAAITFDRFDGGAPGGSLGVWRLAVNPTDPTHVALVKTTTAIPVPRGAHTMVIAR